MEAILACHPALSAEELGWVAIFCVNSDFAEARSRDVVCMALTGQDTTAGHRESLRNSNFFPSSKPLLWSNSFEWNGVFVCPQTSPNAWAPPVQLEVRVLKTWPRAATNVYAPRARLDNSAGKVSHLNPFTCHWNSNFDLALFSTFFFSKYKRYCFDKHTNGKIFSWQSSL